MQLARQSAPVILPWRRRIYHILHHHRRVERQRNSAFSKANPLQLSAAA